MSSALILRMTALLVLLALAGAAQVTVGPELASAETVRSIPVRADEARLDVLVSPAESLSDALARLNRFSIGPEQLSYYSRFETRFRRVIPMAQLDETVAALAPMIGNGLEVDASPRVSLRAAGAALGGVRAVMFAEARTRAEATLREAGYQPGAVVAVAENNSWDVFNAVLFVRLTVTVARAGAPPQTPVVQVAVPADKNATGRFQLDADILGEAGFSLPDLVSSFAKAGAGELQLGGVDVNGLREGRPASRRYFFTAEVPFNRLVQLVSAITSATPLPSITAIPVERVVPNDAEARRFAEPLAQLLGRPLGELRAARPRDAGWPTAVVRFGDFSRLFLGGPAPTTSPLGDGTELLYEFALRDQ